MSPDELAEIDGVKPKCVILPGKPIEAKSATSNSVYSVQRTGDHYYCTCMAWRNQAKVPVNARTCKHLRQVLGDEYEDARLKLKNPDGAKASSKAKAPASKAKKPSTKPGSKRKARESDNDDDDEGSPKKKQAATRRSARSSPKKNYDEANNGADENLAEAHWPGKTPSLLLAHSWKIEGGPDPTGWWISEKLDGVRAYYDGKQVMSRLGNPFTPPQEFLDKLPKDVTLDGELFVGRGKFQETISIVKTVNSPHWDQVTYQLFDAPSKGNLPFEARIAFLKTLFGPGGSHADPAIQIVEQTRAKNRDHVLQDLKDVEAKGGEGLMLREPKSVYEGRRSGTLLKIKTFYDAEARVIGYEGGSGKNTGLTGALKCVMECGKVFKVGSGLSDKLRRNPPKLRSIIIYRFQELTKNGMPRFPSYVGEAIDKTVPKDAELPEHRKGGGGEDNDA